MNKSAPNNVKLRRMQKLNVSQKRREGKNDALGIWKKSERTNSLMIIMSTFSSLSK